MNADARERIGIYRIVRRLGSGGMGEVFLAYDERLDRLVAIKRVRPEAAGRLPGDTDRRERLRREARAAARLSHPNVVQVFDLIEDEAGDSIVFEYVQGRTVADLLRDGPLAPALAAGLAAQIAEGLAAAHAAGLVHRDLKGENVAVTPEGRAKVLDFGLVKPLDAGDGDAAGALTDDGAVLGTWRAMSPEQASGEPVDARSDLFSLGVLLYEMLAGRSPFAGRSPAEILRNVLAAAPLPLGELRPGLPPELTGLVHALLEKDPARRPPGAAAVVTALKGLGELPGPFAAGPSAIGDAPTSAGGTALSRQDRDLPGELPGAPLATDRRPESLSRALSGPRGWRRAAVLALVVAAGAAAFPWLRGATAPEPLRVAVLPPSVAASTEALALAGSGTAVAALRGLLALEGVTAVEPAQIGEVPDGPGGAVAAARAVAADEALTAALDRDGQTGGRTASLSLRRIRTVDGSVLWAERLPVPMAPEDALVLAVAVEAAVRRAYPERRPLAGQMDLQVRAEDYTEMIRVKQRLDAGQGAWAPELARLEAITTGSPRFAEAHLQAAALAVSLFDDTRDPDYLARAHTAVAAAHAASPADVPANPRLLAVEIRLALAERRWDRAEELLAELERRLPGDVLVLIQRSRLAEARGQLDEAIALLREVVARRPGWRDLMRLAELEVRRGHSGEADNVAAARLHLEQVLKLVPGNDWPRAKLGELELLYGDPRRAESIYRRLTAAASPQRSDFTNLGLARALLGDFAGAAESYRQALAIEPGHTTVTINLADAELALGNGDAARTLYAEALAGLEARRAGSPLQPVDRTIEAQCLARLGRTREGVALALETFQGQPGDAEVAYQTALVLALAGDDAAALAVAGKALDLGIRPRWFALPGFERLRADPGLRPRLAGDLP